MTFGQLAVEPRLGEGPFAADEDGQELVLSVGRDFLGIHWVDSRQDEAGRQLKGMASRHKSFH